jgi:hypothetical protein
MKKFLVALLFLLPIPALSQPAHPDVPLDQKQWYGMGEVGDEVSLYPRTAGTDYFTYLCGGVTDNKPNPDLVCVNHYTADCELLVSIGGGAAVDVNIVEPLVPNQNPNKANTLSGVRTTSFLFGFDGVNWDRLLLGAVGELLVTDVATRPGEDAGNDWRKIKKEAIAVYTPAVETSGSIGTAQVTVLAAKEILGYPNCTVYLKNNDAVDSFTDVSIYASPDLSDGWDLGWNTCDALAAGGTCLYQMSNHSYRYILVSVTATDANPVSSVSAWITCNTN